MAGSPPPCPPHPPIGATGASSDSTITIILAIGGVIGTVAGIVGTVITATGVSTVPILGITGAGVGAIGLSAVAGAAVVVVAAFAYWFDRCLHTPDGEATCSAGVIDQIVPALLDTTSAIFPFTAQHDLVSVVAQCQFWPMIEQNAAFIHANATDNSPEIHCYFYNPAVCATEAGATIGAVVGGVGGIVVGIIVGAALGCAGTGPFYFFCLLLACIIAAVIAAVFALVGAFLGGNIAHAIAGDNPPTTDDGSRPSVGDYITTCGKTIIYGNDDGARVYWFVEHSALHGHSMAGAGQQWVHADPDVNLPLDTCRTLCPDNFTGVADPPGIK